MTAGTTVDVTSSDPVAHNVHSHATKNEAPNWQIPGPGKMLPLKLEKREAIKFTCDIHNWMTGYIFVTDNDYYAVTGYKDKDGKWIGSDAYEGSSDTGTYMIKDVPAGKYRLQAWHEELGTTKAQVVEVADGEVKINLTSADFTEEVTLPMQKPSFCSKTRFHLSVLHFLTVSPHRSDINEQIVFAHYVPDSSRIARNDISRSRVPSTLF